MAKVVAAVDPMSVRAHTQASLFRVSHPVKAIPLYGKSDTLSFLKY